MKVGCNNDTNNDGDNAAEFDVVVGRDAIGEIFGNLAVEKDDGATGSQNNKANNHPGNTKRPVNFHKSIIAYQG